MWSIWEKETLLKSDLLIVGSGFTGLSAAIHYRKIHPNESVTVVDRLPFSSGASTRNAGFGCIGSPTELLMDLEQHPKETVYSLVKQRFEGLSELVGYFGANSVGKGSHPGYEILLPDNYDLVDNSLDELNADMKEYLPGRPFERVPGKLEELGVDPKVFPGMIKLNFEFPINSGFMYQSLYNEACSRGVRIVSGVNVTAVNQAKPDTEIEFDAGEKNGVYRARKVLLATNAFAHLLQDKDGIKPGRGMILLSKPLSSPYEGVFHLDRGNVYFRNLGERFLIGGGRHWEKEEEETYDFGINPELKGRLTQLSRELLPDVQFEWEMEWSGIMGFQANYNPKIEYVSENILLGAGLNGMGIALSWRFGKLLASELNNC
jgi:glycine/D-amino acid oxidase-like deaminating enzyme